MARHPFNRGCIEQVGIIFPSPPQFSPVFGQGKGQIEPGAVGLQHIRLNFQAGIPGRLAGGVLQHQHHLEKRGVARVLLGSQFLHQTLERKILMGIGSRHGFPHPP